MSTDQLAMEFAPNLVTSVSSSRPLGWLGLTVGHRILFDALQDDWLLPWGGTAGYVLAVGGFPEVCEQDDHPHHRIPVRIKFDLERLPDIEVMIYRAGEWVSRSTFAETQRDSFVFWPGALPTFAIQELSVSSAEELARLAGLARQVSNISLPVRPRVLDSRCDEIVVVPEPPAKASPGISPSPKSDGQRGALAMAFWAVPRVDPWLDLVCETLSQADSNNRLRSLARNLHSPWLTFPPWAEKGDLEQNSSLEELLWSSAIRVFDSARTGPARSPADLVREIADDCGRAATDAEDLKLRDWSEETLRALRGETKLEMGDWKCAPVGKAIQLVLARRDPSSFKTWKDDWPFMPPSVWLSAAILCGFLHGYRRLPLPFRGEATQQMLFAIYSLRSTANQLPGKWTALIRNRPTWRREDDEVVLSWSGIRFARKAQNPRGQWFSADLDKPEVNKRALDLSQSLGWPCVWFRVCVPPGPVRFLGGPIDVDFSDSPELRIPGPREFLFPPETKFTSMLDAGRFRELVAIESGVIPALHSTPAKHVADKPSRESTPRVTVASLRSPSPAPLVEVRSATEIPGLVYVAEFLTEAEERDLMATIDAGEWSRELKRRVQQFGWRYDYKARELDASMRLGPLPEWAELLGGRLKERGLLADKPDQVIVNEYVRNQGISKHIDCVPCFTDGIAMISLLESWEMIFRDKGGPKKVPKRLERRSVAIMTGPARYIWSHEIPGRFKEPGGRERHRRVSITLRKVDEGKIRQRSSLEDESARS